MMKRFLLLLCGLWFSVCSLAQYSDTLRVTSEDVEIANLPENIQMFGYLSPHVDPQLIYAQCFWATDKFSDKMMRGNNPFRMMNRENKLRKFDNIDDAIARLVLATVDYNKEKEGYTDYLELKPKTNWSPRQSARLLEIYRELFGKEYDHKKQLHKFGKSPFNLHFVKGDSVYQQKRSDAGKSYQKSFAISRTDKNMVQVKNYLGPLAVMASKVDTQMVFIQVLWATDHFNSKQLGKTNNYFQVMDEEGKLKKYETPEDAIADYLVRILDYDKETESYLTYLEKRTNGQWNKKMSEKARQLYKSLYRKPYDESNLRKKNSSGGTSVQTKTSRSRNRL